MSKGTSKAVESKGSENGKYTEGEATEMSIRTLMDAAAHFGHQTERWNPKMLPYIYGSRNGIHIINLDLTLQRWNEARKFIVRKMAEGGNLLFVGTKLQARDIVETESKRCGAFYVTSRWLGGTLTNFQTIKKSIDRMRKLEELLADAEKEGSSVRLHKKEKLTISRQVAKLEANIGGIRGMKRQPDVLFVLDVNKEHIAVAEAKRLQIPVIALVDTNVDPTVVDFAIPSNDDAARTLKLFLAAIADAVIEGKRAYDARVPKDEGSGEQRAPRFRGRGGENKEPVIAQRGETAVAG
jgi:small subunit ribosomal protein S2